MSDVIQFPGIRREIPTESPKQKKRGRDDRAPTLLRFAGDFYLIEGNKVEFVLAYPSGKLAPRLVAAILKQAARQIEDTLKK